MKGFLHFLFKLITHCSFLISRCSKAQRHEFNPNVVAIAERMLITVWMISFQVSLFFIIIVDYGPPLNLPLYGENFFGGDVVNSLFLVCWL